MRTGGEAAALDAREMLAHRIHLADGGAAAQQRARHRLLLFEREPGGRRDPVRRGAAGEQDQHEVVGIGRVGERQRALGRGDAGCIGHRMPGLDHRDVPRRPPIAVAGDREAGEPALRQSRQIMPLGDLGHRACGLSGGEDDEPPARRRLRQVRRQDGRGMGGLDRGAEQRFEQGAR